LYHNLFEGALVVVVNNFAIKLYIKLKKMTETINIYLNNYKNNNNNDYLTIS